MNLGLRRESLKVTATSPNSFSSSSRFNRSLFSSIVSNLGIDCLFLSSSIFNRSFSSLISILAVAIFNSMPLMAASMDPPLSLSCMKF